MFLAKDVKVLYLSHGSNYLNSSKVKIILSDQ